MSNLKNLKCACCGAMTIGRQFHNQDTGYGLCDDCVTYIQSRGHYTQEEFERCYGVDGINYRVKEKTNIPTGKYYIKEQPHGWFDILCDVNNKNGQSWHIVGQSSYEGCAEMFRDAGAVFSATGMTPKLLETQRDHLLAALKVLGEAIEEGDPQKISDLWLGQCKRAIDKSNQQVKPKNGGV